MYAGVLFILAYVPFESLLLYMYCKHLCGYVYFLKINNNKIHCLYFKLLLNS